MSNLDKIMAEPATEQEIKSELHTINTLLENSSGEQRELRLKKKKELETQLAFIVNAKPEDIIIVDLEDANPRTIEMDTLDIATLEMKTVKAPRTANAILADRSICNEANISSSKVSGLTPFKNVY